VQEEEEEEVLGGHKENMNMASVQDKPANNTCRGTTVIGLLSRIFIIIIIS
jgi:hypothetical protein